MTTAKNTVDKEKEINKANEQIEEKPETQVQKKKSSSDKPLKKAKADVEENKAIRGCGCEADRCIPSPLLQHL